MTTTTRRPHLHRLRRALRWHAAVQQDDELDACSRHHWLVRDRDRITHNADIPPLLAELERRLRDRGGQRAV